MMLSIDNKLKTNGISSRTISILEDYMHDFASFISNQAGDLDLANQINSIPFIDVDNLDTMYDDIFLPVLVIFEKILSDPIGIDLVEKFIDMVDDSFEIVTDLLEDMQETSIQEFVEIAFLVENSEKPTSLEVSTFIYEVIEGVLHFMNGEVISKTAISVLESSNDLVEFLDEQINGEESGDQILEFFENIAVDLISLFDGEETMNEDFMDSEDSDPNSRKRRDVIDELYEIAPYLEDFLTPYLNYDYTTIEKNLESKVEAIKDSPSLSNLEAYFENFGNSLISDLIFEVENLLKSPEVLSFLDQIFTSALEILKIQNKDQFQNNLSKILDQFLGYISGEEIVEIYDFIMGKNSSRRRRTNDFVGNITDLKCQCRSSYGAYGSGISRVGVGKSLLACNFVVVAVLFL